MLSDYIQREKLRGFAHRTAQSYPSGKLWPHDEFSYGYVRPRGDGGKWHDDPYVGLGVDDVAMASREGQPLPPLNLRDTPNSQARPRRGMKGITGYGRNMVKGLGAMINRQYPQHRVTFGTITLPPMPPEQRRLAVQSWSEIVRQTLQRIALQAEQSGLPKVVCSVTEIQPRRLQAHGEGYLHLHLIWLNRPAKRGSWTVDPVELRAWFGNLLCRVIPGYTGGYVNVNVKPVDGAIARYMAKYMSKGSEQLAEAWEDWGDDVFPSTWWNMTAPARKLVKDNTLIGPVVGRALESVVEAGLDNPSWGLFPYLRPVMVWLGDSLVQMGWRGRLDAGAARDIEGMLKSFHMEGLEPGTVPG